MKSKKITYVEKKFRHISWRMKAGKELKIGDKAKVIVDSQFRDKDEQRRINQIGTVVEIDTKDEWAYKLEFEDGDNWFKRYHLKKI